MSTVTVKIDSETFIRFLDKITPAIGEAVFLTMKKESQSLAAFIITRHLTGGTTADKLAVRTGHLRRTTRAFWRQRGDDIGKIETGVAFGAKYARVHVGPRGQTTTIRPTRAKNLAIPVGGARTRAGAGRATSPRDIPGLVFIPGKNTPSGSSILALRRGGATVPMFVLKKSVQVKARVDPEEIIRKKKGGIVKNIATAVDKAMSVKQ